MATFYRVLEEYDVNKTFASKKKPLHSRTVLDRVDEDTKSQIRRTVHEFFLQNEPPSIDKILGKVNENDTLPNFKRSTFHKLLLELKFR